MRGQPGGNIMVVVVVAVVVVVWCLCLRAVYASTAPSSTVGSIVDGWLALKKLYCYDRDPCVWWQVRIA